MKTSSGEPPSPLAKQLSEAFETEAPRANLSPAPIPPPEAPPSSELDLPLGTQFPLEDQRPHGSQAELPSKQAFSEEETGQPSETLMANQGSDKSMRDPETPRSSGSKCSRRKPKGKVLGRSPLTILQDDNSPGTLTPRQGKRPSPLSANIRELKEGAILGTGCLLRTGGQAWEQGQDHDKENQHFAVVEN